MCYIWRHSLAGRSFQSTDGQEIRVEHPGVWNRHAGPDFLNARIRIGDTLWAGNVEMHLRASDWGRHGHEQDEKYRNVILHVVLSEDEKVFSGLGRRLPCLDLSEWIPAGIVERYGEWQASADPMPCRPFLHQLNAASLRPWLGRLALERLERRGHELIRTLDEGPEAWEVCFHTLLFRAFGLPANGLPFEMLARIWLRVPGRKKLAAADAEAALLYLSGLLEACAEDPWCREQVERGRALAPELTPLQPALWSLLRMRPAAFPSIRIAQLAAVLAALGPAGHQERLTLEPAHWVRILQTQASAYWDDHYRPGQAVLRSYPKIIGPQQRTSLVANAFAPYLSASGLWHDDHALVRRAVALLERVAPEDNRVVRNWLNLDRTDVSALETQGWMELDRSFCNAGRCLECRIGYQLLGGG